MLDGYPKSAILFWSSRLEKRDVSRSSRTLGAGCSGRGSVERAIGNRRASWTSWAICGGLDERRWWRMAKPCGPGTRCWCQVSGGMSARPGADKPLIRWWWWQDEFVAKESAV